MAGVLDPQNYEKWWDRNHRRRRKPQTTRGVGSKDADIDTEQIGNDTKGVH